MVLAGLRKSAGPGSIEDADALWWAYSTMATVGCGDRVPVTWEGRLIGALLMAAGVGIFGTFSSFIASWFLAPTARKNRSELELLRQEIGELRAMLEPVAKAAARQR